MTTLRDRMRFRQWQQEVKSATLSLAEIAERWARLECGEDTDDTLVGNYLKEIAGELSARQQQHQRKARAATTSHRPVRQSQDTNAVDPWQSLHKMRDKLRAAAAGDRAVGTKLRFTNLMLHTYLEGSAIPPPIGLFPLPPAPQLQDSAVPLDLGVLHGLGRQNLFSLFPESDEPQSGLPDPHSVLNGNANAYPTTAEESCIAHPPTKEDDWYLVIRDTVRDFRAKHKRCPQNKTEIWAWLHENPPSIYRVTSGLDRGGEQALLLPDGSSLGKRAFTSRWTRYTCDTIKHNKT